MIRVLYGALVGGLIVGGIVTPGTPGGLMMMAGGVMLMAGSSLELWAATK